MARNDDTSRKLAATAAAASIILTGAAFWLSYHHLQTVAAGHGLATATARSWAWPATIDLFIIIGETLILRSSLAGRVDPWAIALTVFGSAGSIGLNVAGVGPHANTLDYIVAAVPPIAALLAFGAIMRQLHEHITQAQRHETTEAPDETPRDSVYEEPETPRLHVVAPPAQDETEPETTREASEKVVSAADAAQLLGISRATLYRRARDARDNRVSPADRPGWFKVS